MDVRRAVLTGCIIDGTAVAVLVAAAPAGPVQLAIAGVLLSLGTALVAVAVLARRWSASTEMLDAAAAAGDADATGRDAMAIGDLRAGSGTGPAALVG